MTIDELLAEMKSRFSGRTRWEGQEPRWDEMLVAEVERLRTIPAAIRADAASDPRCGDSFHSGMIRAATVAEGIVRNEQAAEAAGGEG